jgi:hypothetical protein
MSPLPRKTNMAGILGIAFRSLASYSSTGGWESWVRIAANEIGHHLDLTYIWARQIRVGKYVGGGHQEIPDVLAKCPRQLTLLTKRILVPRIALPRK